MKWSDGKPFTASDVAYTFNMIRTAKGLTTDGTPVPTSATAPNATTVVLKFSQPEYANLFLIGQTYIVPQHIWSSVKPATFTDPTPVGTGPYVLDKFTAQGFTLKPNPFYWNKSNVHVPEISYPAYTANFNIVNPLAAGQIDYAGNDIANVQNVYLAKSPTNHTWYEKAPFLTANNVVSLVFNVHKAPLNDPAVRQAISFAINRQQLSSQGETGYELPETSTSGLLLPSANSYLVPALANNLPPAGDPAKVTSILTADGYKKVSGKWTKDGKNISFSISDPIPYSDYYTRRAGHRPPAERRRASTSRSTASATRLSGLAMSPTAPSTRPSTGATRARTRTRSTPTGWTGRSARRSASRPPATSAGSQNPRRRPR